MTESIDKKATTAPDKEDKKGAQNKLEAYLQGPRKKRKNYVILALGESFDRSIAGGIENYVKKSYPQLAISSAKTTEELTRQFGRNISLLIINDVFDNRTEIMTLIRTLKDRRREETIPVLFLTKEPENLIGAYHEHLLLHRESDEYIVYTAKTLPQILSRVKNGIDAKNRRKSRRYPVNIPLTYYHLTHDNLSTGHLIDLSLHGALVQGEEDMIFKMGDQIKISVPTAGYLNLDTGDFIRISGRVRRVFISGNQVAISFEHLSDRQLQLVGELLLAIVGKNFAAQTNRLKAQPAAAGILQKPR
jgi:hypothetical protein